MRQWLMNGASKVKAGFQRFVKEEAGATDIIAIILVIVVVIALVAIFRDSLTGLVNELFNNIKNEALDI